MFNLVSLLSETPALIAAFFLTLLFARIGIPILRQRKMGQPIREDGPQSHLAKSGVPTMGGILMVFAVVIVVLLFPKTTNGFLVLAGMIAFGAIGFLDDFEKLTKKQSLGLTERQKLILQGGVGALLAVLYWIFNPQPGLAFLPFPPGYLNAWILYIPIMIFVLVGTVNATNLTDGLDGLNSLVSLPVFLSLAFISWQQGQVGPSVLALAFAGSLMGFLFYNANPASVFMGDTGSMAIGGAVAMLAVVTRTVWFLPIFGLVYVAEAGSVLIQTFYFRRTGGKRIFLMSPIHHHYELKGIAEQKIVMCFGMISLLACAVGLYFYQWMVL